MDENQRDELNNNSNDSFCATKMAINKVAKEANEENKE